MPYVVKNSLFLGNTQLLGKVSMGPGLNDIFASCWLVKRA